jgi:hypothetical protein
MSDSNNEAIAKSAPALLEQPHEGRLESFARAARDLVDGLVFVNVRAIDDLELKVASHIRVKQQLHQVT